MRLWHVALLKVQLNRGRSSLQQSISYILKSSMPAARLGEWISKRNMFDSTCILHIPTVYFSHEICPLLSLEWRHHTWDCHESVLWKLSIRVEHRRQNSSTAFAGNIERKDSLQKERLCSLCFVICLLFCFVFCFSSSQRESESQNIEAAPNYK